MPSDAATADPEAGDRSVAPRGADDGDAEGTTSSRLALGVFVAAVAISFPLIIQRLGSYHWFFRDDWEFLTTNDDLTVSGLFEPHNAHFSAVPRAAFALLWQVFGATTYTPYQAVVVAMHLSVVVLLRVVMRRAGAGPWIATSAAAALLLFGPGSQDIVWAFQIGFTGAIAFGLGAIVLADRDGPLGRLDLAAFALALLAVMSSGSAIPLVLALGGVTLLRRGWKVAAALTAPVGAAYLLWFVVEDPQSESPFGTPTPRVLAEWIWSGVVGTFEALGHWTVVAVLLAAVLVVGTVLAWEPWARTGGWRRRLSPPPSLVTPLCLFAGSIAFSAITGWGRWYIGPDGARSSRYLYLLVALTLPALAVAAQAIVARQRLLLVPVCALFLVAIPHNASTFEPTTAFGETYMVQRQRIATTAVRMPFAEEVPPDVRPEPDAFDGDLTIGFLLDAAEDGRLEPSTLPLTDRVENEFRIRLGVAQRPSDELPTGCTTQTEAVDLSPEVGDRILITTPVNLMTIDEDGLVTSPLVLRRPAEGLEHTVELPDLRLRVAPAGGATTFTVCTG